MRSRLESNRELGSRVIAATKFGRSFQKYEQHLRCVATDARRLEGVQRPDRKTVRSRLSAPSRQINNSPFQLALSNPGRCQRPHRSQLSVQKPMHFSTPCYTVFRAADHVPALNHSVCRRLVESNDLHCDAPAFSALSYRQEPSLFG